MKISKVGLDLICKFEGFSSHVYKDINGYATIGYGHKLLHHECFDTIDEPAAYDLLLGDVKFAEAAVNKSVLVKLDQNQFDALCSFCYNVGAEKFEESTLLKLVNKNDFRDASYELLKWDHAGGHEVAGLLNRREAESILLYSCDFFHSSTSLRLKTTRGACIFLLL